MGVGAKCQGNVGECKGMPGNIWEWVQSARGMQVNATATYGSGAVQGERRKCWGMPGKRMGVGTKCQGNVGECKGMPGNIWEWVQSAMGMHGSVQSAMGMWEDARGMYGCGCKSQKKAGECREREHMGFGTKCQEKASECRGMLGNTRGTYGSGRNARGIQWNAGKCRGMPGKRMGMCAKCQENAGKSMGVGAKCQGMQENARGTYGRGCKLPGECRGMQVGARECQGTNGSGSKMPGEQRGLQGMPGERMEVGVKCQWNAGECRGIPGYCKGVPGECKGVLCTWGMQRTTSVMCWRVGKVPG